MTNFALLVIVVPEARRDEVVDLLMADETSSGFTRSPAAGFGREHSHFSLRESVQGFEDRERFELVCDANLVERLLSELREIAGRDRFFYWTFPVSGHGVLSDQSC